MAISQRASLEDSHSAETLQGQEVDSHAPTGNSAAPTTPAPPPQMMGKPPPPMNWLGLLAINAVMSLTLGYDVSNVANIQVSIYKDLGGIELLSWIGLSFSVVNAAMIPLARLITKLYDLKALCVAFEVIMMGGAALAGAAPSIECIIVGRALMAIGCSVLYQIALSFNILFARDAKLAIAQATMGAMFAIGLVVGPVIGGAFDANEHATWRWAFYVVMPFCGLATGLVILFVPSYRLPTGKSALTHVKEVDWVGALLHAGSFLTLATACTFPGLSWSWSSGSSIAIWTVFGVVLIAYFLQQGFCLFTTPTSRILPCHLLRNRTVLCMFLCTASIAMAYGLTLYYTPIYFSFAHGMSALESAKRLLPFIAGFVVSIFFAAGILPRVRYYKVFYVISGVLVTLGAGLFQLVRPDTPEGQPMGFVVLIGFGMGLIWQLAVSLSASVLPAHERLNQAALHNLAQLGGVALALSLGAAVYENDSLAAVSGLAEAEGYSAGDVKTLLSGVASPILESGGPELRAAVDDAVTASIRHCFCILIAAGGVCLISSLFLRWEPYQQAEKQRKELASAEEGGGKGEAEAAKAAQQGEKLEGSSPA